MIKKSRSKALQENFHQASIRNYLLSSLLSYLEAQYKFPSQCFRDAYCKFFYKGGREASQDYQNAKVKISELSLSILPRVNPEDIVSKRRENYKFWLDRLRGIGGITVIFEELPDGVCPQVFPIIVDDVESLEEKLLSRGIYVAHWPWLPIEVRSNREYGTANFLAGNLLVLPVHQSIKPKHLEKAAEGLHLP